jgi:hypothetical protein
VAGWLVVGPANSKLHQALPWIHLFMAIGRSRAAGFRASIPWHALETSDVAQIMNYFVYHTKNARINGTSDPCQAMKITSIDVWYCVLPPSLWTKQNSRSL